MDETCPPSSRFVLLVVVTGLDMDEDLPHSFVKVYASGCRHRVRYG